MGCALKRKRSHRHQRVEHEPSPVVVGLPEHLEHRDAILGHGGAGDGEVSRQPNCREEVELRVVEREGGGGV